MDGIATARLIVDDGDAIARSVQAQWAAGELARALSRRSIAMRGAGTAADLTVRIAGHGNDAAGAAARDAGVMLPDAAESFALFESGGAIVAWGRDPRGLVYALTELADRVTHAGGTPFRSGLPLVEQPATGIRSILRIFANEKEDKGWFYDRSMWLAYLTMLATQRFNRFSLTLGIQYDYPYHNQLLSDVYLHFPYPFLLSLPEHGVSVRGLAAEEREANLDTLRFIGRECARRGLEFQLGLWTQRYDFDDAPNANYTIDGVTNENFAPYCRDAIATLLTEVPEITGITFRIHVEGGISEGDYAFWETAFSRVAKAGRPIEINMHAKGLDTKTLAVARATGMPIAVSPKYLAEHIGLAYHTSTVREREFPPKEAITNREQLSVGSRRFTRHSYADFLPKDRDWKVVFRVWPGTQRVLAWGDAALAAGYGRSASFCGADGIEWMEPLSFKGRQGSGIPGGRAVYKKPELTTRNDWEKYAYQYRLWGRLSYRPDAGRESWLRWLRTECGDAAEACERALAHASRILPLITQAHGPSVANNGYWPEIYTNMGIATQTLRRPHGFDMDEPTRFGNAPTFDFRMFANPREYAEALLNGNPRLSYTPLDVADWLEGLAETAELASIRAKAAADFQRPSVQRLLIDAGIAAAVGRFFAEKFRGSCWAEVFLATGNKLAHRRAIDHARKARSAWTTAVQISEHVYQDDLTFGPGHHLRGSWRSRLADIDREVKDLETLGERDGQPPTFGAAAGEQAIAALERRVPVRASAASLRAPSAFHAGEDVAIAIDADPKAEAVLFYRHVNQAERWQSAPMTATGATRTGTIPGSYTRSDFHLQVYAAVRTGDALAMAPGFADDLANAPYVVLMQD